MLGLHSPSKMAEEAGRSLFACVAELVAIAGVAAVKEAEAKVDVDPKGQKRSLESIDVDADFKAEKRARGAEKTRNSRARQQAAVVEKLKVADAAISEAATLKIELDATKKKLADAEARAESAESELERYFASLPPEENDIDAPGGAGYSGDPPAKASGDIEMMQAR